MTTTTKNNDDDDSFINDDNFLENDSNLLEDTGRTVSESRKETFVLKLHREPRAGITLRTGFYHRHHRHVNTCIYIYIQTAIVIYVIARTIHVRKIMLSRGGGRRAEVLFYFFFKPWVFFSQRASV